MDARRLGNIVRTLRIRAGWTQAELARRAGVSPSVVSRIERGLADSMPMGVVHRVGVALDAWVDFDVRWRGGELDRAINQGHAGMHEAVAAWFARLERWELVPEVSFSIYGERGIVDGLAWHADTGTLLVIELKTELVDISAVLGTFDRKLRLGPQIAGERGWRPRVVAGWMLLAEGRTNHRRVAEHRAVLRARFPDDGRRVPGWLLSPSGALMALSFLPNKRGATLRRTLSATRRVRGGRRARFEVGNRAIPAQKMNSAGSSAGDGS